MDATEYAELVAAERSAAAALDVPDRDDLSRNQWRKLCDAYRDAELAREAAFVAFNATVKQQAVDAATAALEASAAERKAVQLANAIVAASDVYEYVGASTEGLDDYALRAVRIACGWVEEHHTIGLGEP